MSSFQRLSTLSLLSTSLAGTLAAHSFQGGVRGFVTDPNGAMVASAKVTLLDQSTAATRATLSSAEGEYVFNQVVPSTYTLIAESPGFKKFERTGVIVGTQQFLSIDLRLEVGQVNETVTSAKNYGKQLEHWNGIDVGFAARFGNGIAQGGVSTGQDDDGQMRARGRTSRSHGFRFQCHTAGVLS